LCHLFLPWLGHLCDSYTKKLYVLVAVKTSKMSWGHIWRPFGIKVIKGKDKKVGRILKERGLQDSWVLYWKGRQKKQSTTRVEKTLKTEVQSEIKLD
jgi:hypothetical protein